MKKLFIVRHAKSNQNFLGNDFERPLNDRGIKDAPEMAKRLHEKINSIDAFISSPAIRAKTTAFVFAKEFGLLSDDVVLHTPLYNASVQTFYEVVSALPNELSSVILFSHNPGITYFINSLKSGLDIDNMPTCGIAAVEVVNKDWSQFQQAKKSLLFFDYPKNNEL